MKLRYFFGCIVAAASLAVWPEIVLAQGEAVMVEEAAVTDLTGEAEAEDTLLSVAVLTDSAVVMHLADSPAAALVRNSAGRGDFLLVAAITAALVTVVSGRKHDFRGGNVRDDGHYTICGSRFRDFDGDFSDFDFYGFGYPDYYQYNYPYYEPYPY